MLKCRAADVGAGPQLYHKFHFKSSFFQNKNAQNFCYFPESLCAICTMWCGSTLTRWSVTVQSDKGAESPIKGSIWLGFWLKGFCLIWLEKMLKGWLIWLLRNQNAEDLGQAPNLIDIVYMGWIYVERGEKKKPFFNIITYIIYYFK